MPREVSERALAHARGTWAVPPLRDATTVVLLRERGGLETFLMRRASTMAFAAGMHVFPGGRIDDSDIALGDALVDGDVDAERMTVTPESARGLIACAVREVFEETGILLAVDESGNVPAEDPEWESDRLAVLDSSSALADVLLRRGLRIDPSILPLWTHWVTPEIETKRYDVRFFVAAVPEGQRVRDVSGEADGVLWIRPADALASYAAGELPMLPPTAATLADLTELMTSREVLEQAPRRLVRPLMPRPRLDDADRITWELIDVRDGRVVLPMAEEPAGSEVHGANGGAA